MNEWHLAREHDRRQREAGSLAAAFTAQGEPFIICRMYDNGKTMFLRAMPSQRHGVQAQWSTNSDAAMQRDGRIARIYSEFLSVNYGIPKGELAVIPATVRIHEPRRPTLKYRVRSSQAGYAELLGMLIAMSIFLVLTAAALPSLVRLSNAQNTQRAVARVLEVKSAAAASVSCMTTSPGNPLCVSRQIPLTSPVTQFGYTYTFTGTISGPGAWYFTAVPVNGQGQSFYTSWEDYQIHCGTKVTAPLCQ